MTLVQTVKQNFDSFLKAQNKEPAWLLTTRQNAQKMFLEAGIPTRKNEDWRYNQFDFLKENSFLFEESDPQKNPNVDEVQKSLNSKNQNLFSENPIYFYDGKLIAGQSLPEGVEVLEFDSLNQETAKTAFKTFAKDTENPFWFLNQTYAKAYYVLIKQNQKELIHFRFVYSDSKTALIFSPHLYLNIAKNTKAKVIQSHESLKNNTQTCFVNSALQLDLQENADLHFTHLQNLDFSFEFIQTVKATLLKDSFLNSFYLNLGANFSRMTINYQLNQENAEAHLDGLMVARENQKADFHTQIDHFCGHTESHNRVFSAVDDSARSIFNGKVIVHPDAQKIKAHQKSKNILLSKNASAYPKPELEIYADDVECSHGATVGQLDDAMLFYLASRGISADAARQMLVKAFLVEALDLVEDENQSEILGKLVFENKDDQT